MSWTVFGIVVGAIVLLLLVILIIPLHILLEGNGEQVQVLVRVLWVRFGKRKKPKKSDSAAANALLDKLGLSRFKSVERIKQDLKADPAATVQRLMDVVTALLRQVGRLISGCRVAKLYIRVVCASEDAAQTAITYGKLSAMLYPAVAYAKTLVKFKKNADVIDLSCNFTGAEPEYEVKADVYVRVYQLLLVVPSVLKATSKKER